MTTVFEEALSIMNDNSGLIRLCNVCKNDIDKGKKHAVFVG